MPHATVIIDGHTMLDANLDEWHQTPPQQFADLIKGGTPQPWMKPIMLALTDALIQNNSIHIEATTGPDCWQLNVATPT